MSTKEDPMNQEVKKKSKKMQKEKKRQEEPGKRDRGWIAWRTRRTHSVNLNDRRREWIMTQWLDDYRLRQLKSYILFLLSLPPFTFKT